MPRYGNNGSEALNGLCVVVAYTVAMYKADIGKDAVSFNIRWAIVVIASFLGRPFVKELWF